MQREYSKSLARLHISFELYAPKTKILEGLTKDEMRLFEALFKGVSTRFGLRTIESPFENQELIFCSFFQNLRLGSMKFFVGDINNVVTPAHHCAEPKSHENRR